MISEQRHTVLMNRPGFGEQQRAAVAARLLEQNIAWIAQPTCPATPSPVPASQRAWPASVVDQRARQAALGRGSRRIPNSRSGGLWQQVASGELSTWFMNGTTLRSGELLVPLAPVTDLLWRIAGPK